MDNKYTAKNITISPFYSSNMVFQRGKPIVIRGKCSPGGNLMVKIANTGKIVQSDEHGIWEVSFPAPDYKGNFTISVIGADNTIKLENVITGNLWVFIGDSWLPAYPGLKGDKTFSGSENNKVRIFQPVLSNNCTKNFRGSWKVLKGGNLKSYEVFPGKLGENIYLKSGEPVGIVNLAWPGLKVGDIVPKPNDTTNAPVLQCNSDSLWKNYYSLMGYNDSLADYSLKGLERGAANSRFDDADWASVNLPVVTGNKWFFKDRILWWRKRILIAGKYLTSGFNIKFGAIRGDFRFYLNDKEIASFKGESRDFNLVLPDTLLKIWSNQLTVRLVVSDSLSGFYGDNIIISNSDSSFKQKINNDWKYRTYYEPVLQKAGMDAVPAIPIQQNILNHIEKISCKGIVLGAGYSFFDGNDNSKIQVALDNISDRFNENYRYMYLIPEPSYIDSVMSYKAFVNARNYQLLAAAQSKWNIVNTTAIGFFGKYDSFYTKLAERFSSKIHK